MNKNELLWLIILGCFGYYFLRLFQTNDVMLFIHPRMYVLVFIAMIVFIAFFLLQILKVAISDEEQRIKPGNILFIIPILLVIIIQPKSLNTTIIAGDEIDIVSKSTFGSSDRSELLKTASIDGSVGVRTMSDSAVSYDNDDQEKVIKVDGQETTDIINNDDVEGLEEVITTNEVEETKEIVAASEVEEIKKKVATIEVEETKEMVSASKVEETKEIVSASEVEETKEGVANSETDETNETVIATDVVENLEVVVSNEVEETKEVVAANEVEETIEVVATDDIEELIDETTTSTQEDSIENSSNVMNDSSQIENPIASNEGLLNDVLVDMGIEAENEQYYEILRMSYEDINNLLGKELKITAFVYKSDIFGENRFYAGRLMITCCAACAQMDGFICEGDIAKSLSNDDWVELTGVVDLTEHYSPVYEEIITVPLIRITGLEKIDEPLEPYVYFKW